MRKFNHDRKAICPNKQGLHARPVSPLVQAATQSESSVVLIKGRKEFGAKSILGIMSVGARKGIR